MVATSTAVADDAIEKMCRERGVPCYRGSENDVLDRFYNAARAEKAAQVVRITADCPLIDPDVIDRVVRRFQHGDLDYASNAMVRTYPDGLDTEICSFSALERAWHEATKTSEREHVTPYLRSEKFRTANVENELEFSQQNYRWTVDEPEDLEFIRAVYKAFRGREQFSDGGYPGSSRGAARIGKTQLGDCFESRVLQELVSGCDRRACSCAAARKIESLAGESATGDPGFRADFQ